MAEGECGREPNARAIALRLDALTCAASSCSRAHLARRSATALSTSTCSPPPPGTPSPSTSRFRPLLISQHPVRPLPAHQPPQHRRQQLDSRPSSPSRAPQPSAAIPGTSRRRSFTTRSRAALCRTSGRQRRGRRSPTASSSRVEGLGGGRRPRPSWNGPSRRMRARAFRGPVRLLLLPRP